jgi:hypothetical protein
MKRGGIQQLPTHIIVAQLTRRVTMNPSHDIHTFDHLREWSREGIALAAESLSITAFLNDRKLSYPHCYPQLILRKTATEPRTLG